MGFQPWCKDVKRRCRSDVLWQIVPDTSSSDWEGSIADGVELSSADNQWWRRGRVQSLSSFEISWLAEFVDVVRRLYTRTASLKSIRSRTFSHWSWQRTGVTWLNFDDGKTSRAAAFITDLSRWRRCAGMPTSVELPKSSRDKTSDDMSDWRTGLDTDWQMLRSWRSSANKADTVIVTWVCLETSESM